MKQIPAFSIVCLVFFALLAGFGESNAQFKKTYASDSLNLGNPSFFNLAAIVETGIPGRELAFTGSVTGQDTGGATHQAVYLAQVSNQGIPQRFDWYVDSSQFVFFGPRAYGMCYDGSGSFYIAMGSNGNQVVMRASQEGVFDWARSVNHHDFYDIICEGSQVTFLGQDESLQGLHDYSLFQLDSAGGGSPGMMFGTTEFDLPEQMVGVPDGYVLAGSASKNNLFNIMIVKSTPALNLAWGRIYSYPNRDMFCQDVVACTDGSGYVFAGEAGAISGGQEDSLFLLKTDTSGSPVWFRLYGIENSDNAIGNCITADPAGNGYLMGGSYYGPQGFRRPFVMRVDASGQPEWARDYGAADTMHDELISDIIVRQAGDFFYAAGDHIELDTNFFSTRRVMLVNASVTDGEIPCDSPLTVGARTATLSPNGSVMSEQFFNVNTYPIDDFSGLMTYTTSCSVFVSVDPAVAAPVRLRFMNPASGEWPVYYEADVDGGTLEVFDLHGRRLLDFPLRSGARRETFDLSGLDAGLYIVRASGDGWRTEGKRLVILR